MANKNWQLQHRVTVGLRIIKPNAARHGRAFSVLCPGTRKTSIFYSRFLRLQLFLLHFARRRRWWYQTPRKLNLPASRVVDDDDGDSAGDSSWQRLMICNDRQEIIRGRRFSNVHRDWNRTSRYTSTCDVRVHAPKIDFKTEFIDFRHRIKCCMHALSYRN